MVLVLVVVVWLVDWQLGGVLDNVVVRVPPPVPAEIAAQHDAAAYAHQGSKDSKHQQPDHLLRQLCGGAGVIHMSQVHVST